MNDHDELEQKLWELEYGLLADEDAAALRQRLATDPGLSSAHAQVRRQLALVAAAAKVEVPRIALDRSASNSRADGQVAIAGLEVIDSQPRSRPSSRESIRRAMNWLIATAALVLLGFFGVSQFLPRGSVVRDVALVPESYFEQSGGPVLDSSGAVQERFAATNLQPSSGLVSDGTEFVKIQVAAPPQLQRNITNNFFFETASVDGRPQSADLAVSFHDAVGEVKLKTVVPTDSKGQAMLALPPTISNDVVRMQVASTNSAYPIDAQLRAAPETYLTHLTVDRPRYRPGDLVRFRSVTLSRYSLKVDREHQVEYSITDSSGTVVSDATQMGTTVDGVGNGEFALGNEISGGQYTVIARSPEETFTEVQRDFYVLTDPIRQWDVRVAWVGEQFLPGDAAAAKIEVKDLEGKPASDVPIRTEAFVDGHPIEIPEALSRTNVNGEVKVEFTLPETIAVGQGNLYVSVASDESIEERIPIQKSKVLVDVFPEGGDLIAGISSRVYFRSSDGAGSPVAVKGRVLDSQAREITEFISQHEGRGVFRITPVQNERYTLQITEPPQASTDTALPVAVREQGIVVDTGAGVFEAAEPLTLLLRSAGAVGPLRVAVNCRGAFVGHLTVQPGDFRDGECEVTVPLAEGTGGVLRVTVFEADEPVAERLVYREPVRKVLVEVDGLQDSYTPGSKVELGLICRDETGSATAGVLGVSIVDDNVLRLARSQPPNLATHFWFDSELESPEGLEDVNFYLSGSPEAKSAIDLLLGTHGWRRFERQTAIRMAKAKVDAVNSYALNAAPSGQAKSAASETFDANLGMFDQDALVDPLAETPLYLDNSSQLGAVAAKQIGQTADEANFNGGLGGGGGVVWESKFGVNPAAPTQSTPDEGTQTRGIQNQPVQAESTNVNTTPAVPAAPGLPTLELVVLVSAILVLCVSGISLIGRFNSNRWIAAFGVVASAIVLAFGLLQSFQPPSVQEVKAIASRSPAAEPAVPTDSPTTAEGVQEEEEERMSGMKAARSSFGAGRAMPAPASQSLGDQVEDADGMQVDSVQPKSESIESALETSPKMATKDPQTLETAAEEQPAAPGNAGVADPGVARRFEAPSSPAPAAPPPPAPAAISAVPPAPAPEAATLEPPAPKAVAETVTRQNNAGKPDSNMPADDTLDKKIAGDLRFRSRMARSRTVLRDFAEIEKLEAAEPSREVNAQESLAPLTRSESTRQSELSADTPSQRARGGVESSNSLTQLRPTKELTSATRFLVRQYAHQRPATKDRNADWFDRTETIYWNPLLVVGGDGRANIEFETSDAATTFRMMVDAHHQGRVGSKTAEIKTGAIDPQPSTNSTQPTKSD